MKKMMLDEWSDGKVIAVFYRRGKTWWTTPTGTSRKRMLSLTGSTITDGTTQTGKLTYTRTEWSK